MVVSPLKALMVNQLEALQAARVPARALMQETPKAQRDDTFCQLVRTPRSLGLTSAR